MTNQMILVYVILAATFLLLISERLRMDLVAMLVLGSLALTGLVTPSEALSGFSNPAVITVWAVFILSAGLSRTGVASLLGRQVLRFAGGGEAGLIVGIMLTAGLLSALLNNVGVAALLLPVVMDIARRTRRPPSRLLMPLAFGALLGGLTTMIGTPPNILASDALRDYGLPPFEMFDFAPVGLAVLLAGVLFMALIGRHLLPSRDIAKDSRDPSSRDLSRVYNMGEHLFVLELPRDSPLAGKTLAESRIGSAVGLNVIAILRARDTQLSPQPDAGLQVGDRLLVGGRPDLLDQLRTQRSLLLKQDRLDVEHLSSTKIHVAEAKVSERSGLVGKTLRQADFRAHFGVNVLAIWRDDRAIRTQLPNVELQAEDTLLIQGPEASLEALQKEPDFHSVKPISDSDLAAAYHLDEHLILLSVPRESILDGRTLAESRLGQAFGLAVLGIIRGEETRLAPDPDETVLAGDYLLVEGKAEDLSTLQALQELKIDEGVAPRLQDLESEQIGLAEVVLSPHTTLAGNTLRELHFREKYGLTVLAIWRQGRAYRTNLGNLPLRFGDALLLYGPREKLQVLGSEPDFLVLTEAAQQAPRSKKAPLAVFVMLGLLALVVLGVLPIAIAAVVGATAMILAGALTMEEAYRYIEWQAVFLIAGMLPLGIAMQQTGAAQYLAEGVVNLVGGYGPLAVLIGLFILTALTSQVMPNPAVTVLMAPIALSTAQEMGVSPYTLMMAVALSASASFLSPVAHPANSLVMGPGGYRFSDYLRVGVPLTVLVLIVVALLLPLVWPF